MRAFKQLLKEQRTSPGVLREPQLPFAPSDTPATPESDKWLNERAATLGGEWTTAHLSFSSLYGKEKRLQSLAGLLPLQEVRWQSEPSVLLDHASVQVSTMQGLALGRLEPAAAKFLRDQSNQANVVLGYVYEIRWRNRECIRAVIALVSWVPFSKHR